MTRMTNQEAITIIGNLEDKDILFNPCDVQDAKTMAIKALEQEPKLRQALEQEKGAYNALVKNIQCADAISRQAVLDLAQKGVLVSNRNYESVCKAINKLPSVNPQEPNIDMESEKIKILQKRAYLEGFHEAEKMLVKQEPKTGHWIAIDEEPHEDYECDNCGYTISTYTANIKPHTEYRYCPNCGARMVEPQESEEKE